MRVFDSHRRYLRKWKSAAHTAPNSHGIDMPYQRMKICYSALYISVPYSAPSFITPFVHSYIRHREHALPTCATFQIVVNGRFPADVSVQ